MNELIEGYRRFRESTWAQERQRFELLAAQGQSPRALVIACSDSRVDPQMIFGAGPGELFVVRNVANLVPPYAPDAAYHGTSAALEFAVKGLEVRHIVVLGHAQCGGVRALLEGVPPLLGDFLDAWVQIGRPARDRAITCEDPDERQTACEHEVVKVSLENLMTFPWIRERVEAGRLSLHGCFFGVASGRLLSLSEDGQFRSVAGGSEGAAAV